MAEREALNMALQALETLMIERGSIYDKAITAIKEALAQQETLPWIDKMVIDVPNKLFYTAPHTWVELTLDERIELAQDVDWAAGAYCDYAEKIEAKLKEKNCG